MYRISLRHNFETAHRLSHPDAPHKCQSIHGHSWWVTATLEGPELDEQGMLVEFGAFKKAWRAFLDARLDHHLVVQREDPVAAAILAVQPDARILLLDVDPTTEHLARWLLGQTARILADLPDVPDTVRVHCVHVQETSVNAAEFEAL